MNFKELRAITRASIGGWWLYTHILGPDRLSSLKSVIFEINNYTLVITALFFGGGGGVLSIFIDYKYLITNITTYITIMLKLVYKTNLTQMEEVRTRCLLKKCPCEPLHRM